MAGVIFKETFWQFSLVSRILPIGGVISALRLFPWLKLEHCSQLQGIWYHVYWFSDIWQWYQGEARHFDMGHWRTQIELFSDSLQSLKIKKVLSWSKFLSFQHAVVMSHYNLLSSALAHVKIFLVYCLVSKVSSKKTSYGHNFAIIYM